MSSCLNALVNSHLIFCRFSSSLHSALSHQCAATLAIPSEQLISWLLVAQAAAAAVASLRDRTAHTGCVHLSVTTAAVIFYTQKWGHVGSLEHLGYMPKYQWSCTFQVFIYRSNLFPSFSPFLITEIPSYLWCEFASIHVQCFLLLRSPVIFFIVQAKGGAWASFTLAYWALTCIFNWCDEPYASRTRFKSR